jgi:hypothetical protein
LDAFLGKMQLNDQAKDTLSAISRKLEVITLEQVKEGWQHNLRLL